MKTLRPNIVFSVGRSYLRSLFKRVPVWAHLYVTRRCNFSCKYCADKNNQSKDPSFEELCARILKLKSIGCNCVSFMGGEPTLREDIVALVEFCSRNKIYGQLSTNGAFLIHPSKKVHGETLLERLVGAGLGTINLSVDSVTSGFDVSGKELPKTTEILKALLKEKKRTGLNVILNCVISKKNLKNVPQILEFCHRNKLVMAAIFVQDPNPSQEEKDISILEEILFSPTEKEEVIEIIDYLIAKKRKGYRLVEPIAYFESVKKWVKGELDWECEGGRSSLAVDTDGRIGLCTYLPYLDIDIRELKDHHFHTFEEYRKAHRKLCTNKCIPSCMFCTMYYRQHPWELVANQWKQR